MEVTNPILESLCHVPWFMMLIQGVSEAFPVSSSAHLLFFRKISPWLEHHLPFKFSLPFCLNALRKDQLTSLEIDTALHLGSFLALLWVCRYEILWGVMGLRNFLQSLIKGTFFPSCKVQDPAAKFSVILGMLAIPVALIGGILSQQTWFSHWAASPRAAGFMSIVASLMLALAFHRAPKAGERGVKGPLTLQNRLRWFPQLHWRQWFWVGLFPIAAFFPGVSRLGMVMTAGCYVGLSIPQALKLAWVTGLAPLAGGFLLGFWKRGVFWIENPWILSVIVLGVMSLNIPFFWGFQRWVSKKSFQSVLIMYRIFLGLLLLMM